MTSGTDILGTVGIAVVLVLLAAVNIAIGAAILWLVHFALTLPMRRAERARLFLNVIDAVLKDGRPIEASLISLAESRDLSMGVRFHLVAAWLEQGVTLEEALAKAPRFLPPQITAMLAAGRRMGNMQKVLPVCRELLRDATSQTRGALHYLVLLSFVITPIQIWLAGFIMVAVLPKFREIGYAMGAHAHFTLEHIGLVLGVQCVILFALWAAVVVYLLGPGRIRYLPFLDRVYFALPWRRKRLQRDFAAILAVALDSGVPEADAVALAGTCTANSVMQGRAHRTAGLLAQGVKLPDAVARMDDSDEFRWRLRNAAQGRGGFVRALAGWLGSLDAKAFQQEQAAAHGITTALVAWTGLWVGWLVVAVFGFLVSIIDEGVLW